MLTEREVQLPARFAQELEQEEAAEAVEAEEAAAEVAEAEKEAAAAAAAEARRVVVRRRCGLLSQCASTLFEPATVVACVPRLAALPHSCAPNTHLEARLIAPEAALQPTAVVVEARGAGAEARGGGGAGAAGGGAARACAVRVCAVALREVRRGEALSVAWVDASLGYVSRAAA